VFPYITILEFICQSILEDFYSSLQSGAFAQMQKERQAAPFMENVIVVCDRFGNQMMP
jgi:hypothetical protein